MGACISSPETCAYLTCGPRGANGCIINFTDINDANRIGLIQNIQSASFMSKDQDTPLLITENREINNILNDVTTFKVVYDKLAPGEYTPPTGYKADHRTKWVDECTRTKKAITAINDMSHMTVKYARGEYFAAELVMKEGKDVTIDRQPFGSIYVIFQEYCQGDLVNRKLDIEQIHEMVNDIKNTLTKLHSNKYIHGDIKQENVVRCLNRFKLIDFDRLFQFGEKLKKQYGTERYTHPIILMTQDFSQDHYNIQKIHGDTLRNYNIMDDAQKKMFSNDILPYKTDEYAFAMMIAECLAQIGTKIDDETFKNEYNDLSTLLNKLCSTERVCVTESSHSGGAKAPRYIKTDERVKVGNTTRIVYKTKYGKRKYIKQNGKYVVLSKK